MRKLSLFPAVMLLSLLVLLVQPGIAQTNTVLTSVTTLPGGTGFNSVAIGPDNTYPAANGATQNIFIGKNAGTNITTGSYNSFIGFNAGNSNTTGSLNSFLGDAAGYNNSTGSENSFMGGNAGRSNTTGFSNSFTGSNAGYSNTAGNYNSFLGGSAGYSNTTGSYNSFTGHQAGYSNTTGFNNSFLGFASGFNNTTGNSNSFLGQGAGSNNTTGSNNSFMGTRAGVSNTNGGGNSFMGYETGYANTTGINNSFIGIQAGYSNTTGNFNSFIGFHAGYSNNTGSNNSFMGTKAGYSNTTGNFNSFIGFQAGVTNTTGSNNLFMGERSGAYNTTGSNNSFLGYLAGLSNTTGSDNSFTGYLAGQSNIIGHQNSFMGSYSNVTGPNYANLQRASAIGSRALVAVDDGLVLGDTSNVKVGIGTAYPNQRFTLRGNMNFVAYDNSMMLKSQPFLHFNEHESLALGLGSEIAPGAEKTLVLGSKETTVQIPGIVNSDLPRAGQFLTVDKQGNLHLTQSRIQVASVADWSDKVFESGYALRPLGEVEEFVKKNKHLPGVPSAVEMVAEGMESAAFNAKLLEKIEELTLYVLDLEKKNHELEKKVAGIDELRSLVLTMKKRLDTQ